jgi:hypothetical protein
VDAVEMLKPPEPISLLQKIIGIHAYLLFCAKMNLRDLKTTNAKAMSFVRI